MSFLFEIIDEEIMDSRYIQTLCVCVCVCVCVCMCGGGGRKNEDKILIRTRLIHKYYIPSKQD